MDYNIIFLSLTQRNKRTAWFAVKSVAKSNKIVYITKYV